MQYLYELGYVSRWDGMIRSFNGKQFSSTAPVQTLINQQKRYNNQGLDGHYNAPLYWFKEREDVERLVVMRREVSEPSFYKESSK